MSDSINLDLLTGEPKTVRLGGRDYLVPPDLPIPTAARIDDLTVVISGADEGDEEATQRAGEALMELYGLLLPLFQLHQPELERVPLSPAQVMLFVPMVYGGWRPDAPEPEADPTKAAAGTRSTAKKSKPRSRSSASSKS